MEPIEIAGLAADELGHRLDDGTLMAVQFLYTEETELQLHFKAIIRAVNPDGSTLKVGDSEIVVTDNFGISKSGLARGAETIEDVLAKRLVQHKDQLRHMLAARRSLARLGMRRSARPDDASAAG